MVTPWRPMVTDGYLWVSQGTPTEYGDSMRTPDPMGTHEPPWVPMGTPYGAPRGPPWASDANPTGEGCMGTPWGTHGITL